MKKEAVFDCHVHLYPDGLSPRVIPMLSERFGNPAAFDGTVAGVKRDMESSGVNAVLNLPVATRPDQVESINQWAEENNSFPVYSLATVHPDTPDLPACLRDLKKRGFLGIKLHPEYQKFFLDDPRMAPVWSTCCDLGLLVMLHAGGERVFSPPFHTSPKTIAALMDRYPGIRLAAAHMGGFQMWDEVEEVLLGRDIWLDLSHCLNWCPDEQIVRMVRAHGTDRVMWGTDAPWQKPSEILKRFYDLPFTREEQRKILWANTCRMLQITPPIGDD